MSPHPVIEPHTITIRVGKALVRDAKDDPEVREFLTKMVLDVAKEALDRAIEESE